MNYNYIILAVGIIATHYTVLYYNALLYSENTHTAEYPLVLQ